MSPPDPRTVTRLLNEAGRGDAAAREELPDGRGCSHALIERRSVKETAALLGISEPTVESDWDLARALLHRELRSGESSMEVEGKK